MNYAEFESTYHVHVLHFWRRFFMVPKPNICLSLILLVSVWTQIFRQQTKLHSRLLI